MTTEEETTAPDPNVPVLLITPEDLVAGQGKNDMDAPVLSEDGSYVTITPTGNDSYCYPYGNPAYLTGSRYIAIKYRSTIADGMNMQVYMGSGSIASDNDMIETPIIADGEWHLIILDAMLIDGQTSDMTGGGTAGAPAGSYDGENVAFLRFDPMNCAYKLDENGKPYKLEDGSNWVRYDKPEGAYIDVAYLAFFSTTEGAMAYEYGAPDNGDGTIDFTSDAASQDGVLVNSSDLSDIFVFSDPLQANPTISGGMYTLPSGFFNLIGTADGAYVYTVDIASTSAANMSGIFVRGFASAAHEGSYYGVLSGENVNAYGGPGIYLNINSNPVDNSMKLRIDIRSVDTATGVLTDHVYEQYVDSGVISVADDGSTVFIMAGGKLIATVAISGEQVAYTNTYMGGSTGEIPAGALATTAVLTLADGTVETIENAAVAASCKSDFGIACRTAAITIASVSMKPFSTTTIPEDFTKIDPPVFDENAPIGMLTSDVMVGSMTNGTNPPEVLTDTDGSTYLHLTPNFETNPFDPWILLFAGQENPPFIVVTYRTNTTSDGQFFAGHGAGPNGSDTINVNWNESGNWEYMLINFNDHEHIIKKDGKINYLRSDFIISQNEGDYFDIKSIAFFDSAENAAAYIAPKFEYDAPIWDADKAVVTHQSFDELRKNGTTEGVFTPGASANWNFEANMTAADTLLQYWGWIGIKADTVGQFGYQIDKTEAKFDNAWTVTAEQGVLDAAAGTGAATASRMLINIDITGLSAGKHIVNVFYKAADGSMVTLNTFVLNIAE